MKKRTKESTKRLNSLILLIAFTAIFLIISTYAWFTTQKNVQISNLSGLVNVAEGMEISLDAQNWFGSIDLSKAKLIPGQIAAEGTTFEYETYENGTDTYNYVNTNVMPDGKGLLPVSSIGEIDGKQISMTSGKYSGGRSLSSAKTYASDVPSEDGAANGYFAFDLFVKNTNAETYTGDLTQKIALTDASTLTAKTVEEDPANNIVSFDGSTYGVQNTMRVAMALSSGTVPATTSSQAAILQGTYADLENVTIWEPNADSHVANVVDNFCGDKSLLKINSAKNNEPSGAPTWFKFGATDRFFTFGVIKQTGSNTIADIYNWTTTESDNPVKPQNTVQTPSDPDKMYITKLTLADEASKTTEFAIAKNAISKIRIYVWMEGQDVDTINYASYGGGIDLNLGFMRDADEFAIDADSLWAEHVPQTAKKLADLDE